MTSTASAQPDGKGGPQRGGKGQAKGKRGDGNGGNQDRAQRGQRDPQEMVKRMIQQFDKNGDKALDAKELLAMFTQMRQGRGQGGPQRGQGGPQGGQGRPQRGKGGPGQGKGGQGKGGQGKGGKGGAGKGKGRPDFN